MTWIDTHAHLAEPALRSQLRDVLTRASENGVEGILCVAVDAETSAECLSIASEHGGTFGNEGEVVIRSSAGIHPNYAHQEKPGDWESIEELLTNPRVIALGETGLDLYWDDCPFDLQRRNFARHWEAGRRHGLPVIVHMRECEKEMLEALEEEYRQGLLQGVMHSYSGSLDTALRCLEMGMHISFAGMLTYKKSIELRDIASQIPLDRLLVETDCPYLSPEPHRSKRPNEPCRVIHTAEVLARAKSVSREELSRATLENTKRLFRWS